MLPCQVYLNISRHTLCCIARLLGFLQLLTLSHELVGLGLLQVGQFLIFGGHIFESGMLECLLSVAHLPPDFFKFPLMSLDKLPNLITLCRVVAKVHRLDLHLFEVILRLLILVRVIAATKSLLGQLLIF